MFRFQKDTRSWEGPVKAEGECYEDDFYSAKGRKNSEEELAHIERVYSELSRKVYNQGFRALTEEEVFNLRHPMLLLFARNPIHRHTGVGGEERDRTRVRYPAAVQLLASHSFDFKRGSEEHFAWQAEVQSRWSLSEARAPNGSLFVTSDSPVVPVFLKGGKRSRTLVYIMPFDPDALWVLADQDVDVSKRLATPDDVKVINQLVATQALKAVYANKRVDPTVIEAGFNDPYDLESEFKEDGWSFEPKPIDDEISFLESRAGPVSDSGTDPRIVSIKFRKKFT